jgi:hypothetical protein
MMRVVMVLLPSNTRELKARSYFTVYGHRASYILILNVSLNPVLKLHVQLSVDIQMNEEMDTLVQAGRHSVWDYFRLH